MTKPTPPAPTFSAFQKLNWHRCLEIFRGMAWRPSSLALAIAGEVGELCDLIKGVERGDFSLERAREDILRELADVIIYCDLLMTVLGADTGETVIAKFDEVSARMAWKQGAAGGGAR